MHMVFQGLPASLGVVTGPVVFRVKDAVAMVAADKNVKPILVCSEITPEERVGIEVVQGFLVTCGGQTSNAAILVRHHLRKPCVIYPMNLDEPICVNFRITGDDGRAIVRNGDIITIDGSRGEIIVNSEKSVVIVDQDGVKNA